MFLARFTRWLRPEPPEPDPRAFLETVVDGLRLAALPAEEQIAVLPDFVVVPDEVVEHYDLGWKLVPQIRGAGLLTDKQHDALARLDRHYEEMLRAPDADALWTIDAMRRDRRWAKSRQLAVEALNALGRTPSPPRFEGITWVPVGEE